MKICVFCGSKVGNDKAYSKAAEDLGKLIAHKKWSLIYGGGKLGLMGVLAKNAKKHNGYVTSVIPRNFNSKKIISLKSNEIIISKDIGARKKYMIKNSDLFIALPGGMGTYDEIFEILALNGLNLINKPIIFINIKRYWTPFKKLLSETSKAGFLNNNSKNNIYFIKSIDKTIEFIETNI